MAAARKKRAHQVVAKALLKAVKDLHPDEALEALEPFYLRERNGMRRRALRAARISLMQRAIEAPPRVILPVVEAVPEPEPEPVVVTEPPAPKPAPKGKLLSVSLEDAARLLFVSPEPDVPTAPPAQEAAAEQEPEFVPLDWGAAAAGLAALDMPEEAETAVADLPIMMVAPTPSPVLEPVAAEVAENDPPVVAAEAAAPAPPKRRKAAVKAAMPDLSAQFAALSDEGPGMPDGTGDGPPMTVPPLAMDPAAAFAAMEGEETTDVPAPRMAALTVDPAAGFAALAAAEEFPPAAAGSGKPKPLAIDLSAQFAALAEDGDETKAG